MARDSKTSHRVVLFISAGKSGGVLLQPTQRRVEQSFRISVIWVAPGSQFNSTERFLFHQVALFKLVLLSPGLMIFILCNRVGAQLVPEIQAWNEGLNNNAAVLIFEFTLSASVYLSP